MHKIILAVFTVCFFFTCCKKDRSLDPVDIGRDYFPVDTGDYFIYAIDSIFYDDNTGNVDTFLFQLREVYTSSTVNKEGHTFFRLERSRRDNGSAQWSHPDVWQAVITPTSLEVIEENISFMKLVFPVVKGKSWNGNARNSLGESLYRFTTADSAALIGNISYASTTTVSVLNEVNLIQSEQEYEIFAKGWGRVRKYKASINTLPGGDTISGFIRNEILIEKGKL